MLHNGENLNGSQLLKYESARAGRAAEQDKEQYVRRRRNIGDDHVAASRNVAVVEQTMMSAALIFGDNLVFFGALHQNTTGGTRQR